MALTCHQYVECMLKAIINEGGQVKACGICSEARGIKGLALLEGIEINTMSQLTKWTSVHYGGLSANA